jgi:leucine dehydrogenase
MVAFEEMARMGHEQVVFCRNDSVGLRAIIAVHDTTLGPALGGCRLFDYASEADAVRDVLRLSRGMTYKAAVAGLDLGGGKAVIIGDPSIKNEALFRAFGRHVQALGGRYITAEDMNTNVEDMNWIRRETGFVTGTGAHHAGSGDPSPVTAWGVFHGIRACLEVVYGSSEISGRSIAIQGVGNVGYHLARYLRDAGARLVYSDINQRNIKRAMEQFGGEVVDGDDFYRTDCDVLAPCAIGGIINKNTIPLVSKLLMQRKVTYAPDYVINAGGLMSVHAELKGHPHEKAMADSEGIFNTVKRVLHKAQAEGISTITASNRVAEERIEAVARISRLRV